MGKYPWYKRPEELDGNSLTGRSMKSHKFIIYFSLFMGALYSLSDGLRYITGAQYSNNGFSPAQFYAVFPTVKSLDMIFGIACLGQAVYCLYARQRLAHLKGDGPAHLKALAILGMLMSLAYLLMASSAMKLPVRQFINPQLLGSLLGSAIYLLIIWIYYDKRKAMFINL